MASELMVKRVEEFCLPREGGHARTCQIWRVPFRLDGALLIGCELSAVGEACRHLARTVTDRMG